MLNIIKKLQNNRPIFKTIIFVVVFVVFLFNAEYAMAADAVTGSGVISDSILGTVGVAVTLILSLIAYILTAVLGLLMTLVVKILIQVAQYGNIINVPTVIEGWVIIRDLCNMFFILILLVVAFATILRIETYQWKKILPKLLIMAVLINFSRTIFGLLIDFSQVIMLTFVNAFSAGGGWFINAFQVNSWYSITTGKGGYGSGQLAVTTWSTALSIIAGVLAAIISLIVVSVMLATLVMRIIMLWVYTIFSPLVFMGFAVPALQKYTSKIWEDFTKQLVVGPVLAFFIWLALTTAQSSSSILGGQNLTSGVSAAEVCVGVGAFFCEGVFQQFIIVIGLLMGGLMVAQQMGGAAGAIAGKGLDWAKKSPKLLGGGAMFAGGWLGRKVKSGSVSSLLATKQVDEEGNVSWKGRMPGFGGLAGALYGLEIRPTKIIQGIREGIKSQAEKEEAQATGASAISLRRGGVGGMIKGLGVSRDLTEAILGPGGILWHKGFNRVFQATLKGGLKGVANTEKELASLRAGRGVTQAEYDEVKKQYDEKGKARSDAYAAGKKDEGDKFNEEFIALGKKLLPMRSKIVDKGERDKQDAAIEKLETKLSLRKPIQTFYADRAREELISKASKTMGDNDNEEALVEMFKDALANGNKEVAQAVMLHAAKVGHLNEVIQGYKSKKDIKDERGNLLVKKGGALPQGGYGLHELVKQALIEDLGIDEHSALATQSEASTLAKSVRHANLSESVGSKNGFLFQRKIEEPGVGQQARARGEARKVDPERYLRDYNRLAWGDEFMNASGGRDFKLNALGLDTFTEMADVIAKEITRGRFNKNAAMNIAGDRDTLMDWARELDKKGIKYYDEAKKGDDKMESYMTLAEKLIGYGDSIRQAQGKSEVSSGIKKLQTDVLNKQTRPT